MRPSLLNRRISIQANKSVEDPLYGVQPAQWVGVASVWAEIQDVLPSKSESIIEGALVSYRRTRIRIRYRAGIDSTMRIIETGGLGRVWQIIGGPAVVGNRKGIELLCEEYSIKEDL